MAIAAVRPKRKFKAGIVRAWFALRSFHPEARKGGYLFRRRE